MGMRCALSRGAFPSIGRPSTSMARPSISMPTGAMTGPPVSVASKPGAGLGRFRARAAHHAAVQVLRNLRSHPAFAVLHIDQRMLGSGICSLGKRISSTGPIMRITLPCIKLTPYACRTELAPEMISVSSWEWRPGAPGCIPGADGRASRPRCGWRRPWPSCGRSARWRRTARRPNRSAR